MEKIKRYLSALYKDKVLYECVSFLFTAAIIACAVLFVENVLIINARIPSASMESTINAGDLILGNRLSYIKKSPERGDIVIFYEPDGSGQLYIKRIVGLPGDTVSIQDGKIFVNDIQSDEYCPESAYTPSGMLQFPVLVPENSYFLLGDNRENSFDSRFWENTFLPKENIVGKAVFRYWPVWKMKNF